MAITTTAQLLAFCKQQARRPAVDESMSDLTWYSYLDRGQTDWLGIINTMVPNLNKAAPVALTSSDSGVTYTFGTGTDGQPLYPSGRVELYDGVNGRKLVPGAFDDLATDYVIEGNQVRMPGNRARTFANGLYARWDLMQPPTLTVGVDPQLQPAFARILIAWRALKLWATELGLRDPQTFHDAEVDAWNGDPMSGQPGILAQLRTAFGSASQQAIGSDAAVWWRGMAQ